MLASVWTITEYELTIRILISALCGGFIGLERELNNHAAGFRTHILVCIGSTCIMLLSVYGFAQFANESNVRIDPARLAAQVITGIGFLGAGAIMRTGSMISGLTTAASIWVVAAIGLCIGAGFMYVAGLATVLVVIILFVLNKIESVMMRRWRKREIVVHLIDRPGVLASVTSLFARYDIQISNLAMKSESRVLDNGNKVATMEVKFTVRTKKPKYYSHAMDLLIANKDIIGLESEYEGQIKDDGKEIKDDREMSNPM
ncbi:MgtC/SapB family protein [Paenibacillus yanchengensis]|uniref:MgtC/SapB family protein n=1 Tax=Paenibacillus yanchengensis TaxID=2035833 RepID=A0ABW4YLA0_9BACL